MGDFNQILEVVDRRGQTVVSLGIRNFQEWLDSRALIELPLSDTEYIWSIRNSRSMIDKCFYHSKWLVRFPSLTLPSDKISISYHTPLIISIDDTPNLGPKPFRNLLEQDSFGK